jgi:hypothetical protein
MHLLRDGKTRPLRKPATAVVVLALALMLPLALAGNSTASSPTKVALGTADSFALLAAAAISDVPTSTVSGDVGLSPTTGAAITGLTCAGVTGTIYTVDAAGPPCRIPNPGLLTTATTAVTNAYVDAAGRSPDTTFIGSDNQLGGQTLVAGVYRIPAAVTANLAGNLTLNGDADAVWIFQATSSLVTAGSSTVTLTGGAQACNVFWQVGSSATLGASSTLEGTVLSNTSISVGNSATVHGRLFAGAQAPSGAITLIADTITRPSSCVSVAQITSQAAQATAQANAEAAFEAAQSARIAAEQLAFQQAAEAARLAQVAKATEAARLAAVAEAARVSAAAAAQAQAAQVATRAAAAKAAAAKATAAKVAAAKKTKVTAAKKAGGATTSTKTLARPARRHAGFTG